MWILPLSMGGTTQKAGSQDGIKGEGRLDATVLRFAAAVAAAASFLLCSGLFLFSDAPLPCPSALEASNYGLKFQ